MGNRGDLSGRRRKHRQGSIGYSVDVDPRNLENSKEAVKGTQDTHGSSKQCTSRDGVSPLSRLTRVFRLKHHVYSDNSLVARVV